MQAAFQDGKQYLVPSYQRNYVWTQEGQWEPLWDDVKAVMTRIIAKGQSATQPHFLGAIITKHIDTIRLVNRWWVVDGQQRLTTLQVPIAAAKSVFANSGLPVAASQLGSLLANPSYLAGAESDRYKITHKSSDYEVFTRLVDTISNTPKLGDALLGRCYIYFHKTVETWV